MKSNYIIFCENPIEKNKIDPDFTGEYNAALKSGFKVLFYNYDNLINGKPFLSGVKFSKNTQIVIYRGWMLTPAEYEVLYQELLQHNFVLINTTREYQNCHYLPDSLKFIETLTPKTIFEQLENEDSLEKLLSKSETFKNLPVIIKDYVKSEKHFWDTACFVKDASNKENLRQTISNLIRLRGSFLNKGIVIREFIEFNHLTNHSQSGMPLTEEYRLFFLHNKLLSIYDYWEEGDYTFDKPDTTIFEEIACTVPSHFFSMDIARRKDGIWMIVELGDGQVSGLPQKANENSFYQILAHHLLNE